MNYLKRLEDEAEKAGRQMTSLGLAEEIGTLKSELTMMQARLRGLQKAMKVKLNSHPEFTK